MQISGPGPRTSTTTSAPGWASATLSSTFLTIRWSLTWQTSNREKFDKNFSTKLTKILPQQLVRMIPIFSQLKLSLVTKVVVHQYSSFCIIVIQTTHRPSKTSLGFIYFSNLTSNFSSKNWRHFFNSNVMSASKPLPKIKLFLPKIKFLTLIY